MTTTERPAPHRGDGQPNATAAGALGAAAAVRGLVQRLGDRARVLLDPSESDASPGPLARLATSATWYARSHARLTDAAIAAAVFAAGALDNALDNKIAQHALISAGIFTFLLALPLVWRRRAPISVFLAVAVVAFAQWSANLQLLADVALLIALYSVANFRPRRAAVGAAIIAEIGAVLAAVRWSSSQSAIGTFALLSGTVVAALACGVYFRTRRAHVAGLVERAARLEFERDQQGRLAAAAERTRIAREMHDVIAHSLAVVIALADGATAKLQRDPEQAGDALASVCEVSRQALGDTRRLLSVLRSEEGIPVRAPQPGIDQIAELVDQVASTSLTATLASHGDPQPITTGLGLTAYRIVQEAVTNTLRHAKDATAIAVELAWLAHQLEIVVTDNGRGTTQHANPSAGFGLAGMRERAALYGGTLAAGPRPGGGWAVTATLPAAEPTAT